MKQENNLEPVSKVKLDSTGLVRRIIIFVIALVVAIGSITYGVYLVVKGSSNAKFTTYNIQSDLVVADDISLTYYDEGINRTVRDTFSSYYEEAYIDFDSYKEYDDHNNVWYINNNPNTDIHVSDLLYDAFTKLQSLDLEEAYLYGPITRLYTDRFLSNDTADLNQTTYLNYYKNYINLVKTKEISLILKNNNIVNLYVSADALDFLENDNTIIDFTIFRNAFIMDYIAKNLIDNGYTYGYLRSYEGYYYHLDNLNRFYSSNSVIDNLTITTPIYAAKVAMKGRFSYVSLKIYPAFDYDILYYALNSSVTPNNYYNLFIDSSTGVSKNTGIEELISYSAASMIDNLINTYLIFTNNSVNYSNINEKLISESYNYIYVNEGTVYYTEKGLNIADYYSGSVKYKGECLNA